ncbi:MAG: hypothetical protein FJ087_20290 [Deltaproteobacteria bacterium]|nr:hypothetical protein [Deltaproteobacteria bacterium]
MTRSPLTIAFDAALLAGDFAIGTLLAGTIDAVLTGDPAADTTIGRAVPWVVLGAVAAHVVALATFKDVLARRPAPPGKAGTATPWTVWFFAILVAMILTTGAWGAVASITRTADGTLGVVVGIAGLLLIAPLYGRLSMRALRPAPEGAPEPARGRTTACLAMMVPLGVLALAPADGLAARAGVGAFEGPAAQLLAALAGGAALAGLGCLLAWWPRWLAVRAAGHGLSGRAFFAGLWISYFVRLADEPFRGWFRG